MDRPPPSQFTLTRRGLLGARGRPALGVEEMERALKESDSEPNRPTSATTLSRLDPPAPPTHHPSPTPSTHHLSSDSEDDDFHPSTLLPPSSSRSSICPVSWRAYLGRGKVLARDAGEDDDGDLDGEPLAMGEGTPEAPHENESDVKVDVVMQAPRELAEESAGALTQPETQTKGTAPPPPSNRAENAKPEKVSQPQAFGEESIAQRILSAFWGTNHISKLHRPSYHLFQDPSAVPFTNAFASDPEYDPKIGCTVTITLPSLPSSATDNDRTPKPDIRTFTTPPIHRTRRSARNAAAQLALDAGICSEARSLRERLGPEVLPEEGTKGGEQVAERPYEALMVAWQRWMVGEQVRWEFETDELNITHGCLLTVPIPSSAALTFRTPTTYASHRLAKDAAARLALAEGENNVPKAWEKAFKERVKVDTAGYISVDAGGGGPGEKGGGGEGEEKAGAAEAERERREKRERERVDPINVLTAEVRAALGAANKYIAWEHGNAPAKDGLSAEASQVLLSCTLTLTFPALPSPSSSSLPSPPQPSQPTSLQFAVPAIYHTKGHARMACASAALASPSVREALSHAKENRERERRDKDEAERRKRDEAKKKKGAAPPHAGSVKYEDLDGLDNPAAYLNLCAQQWTGNGSPIQFEYTAIDVDNAKHHGCTISIYVDPSLTQSYTLEPAADYPNRKAAKEAVIRLALRERVLDVLKARGLGGAAKGVGKGARGTLLQGRGGGTTPGGGGARGAFGGGGGGGGGGSPAYTGFGVGAGATFGYGPGPSTPAKGMGIGIYGGAGGPYLTPPPRQRPAFPGSGGFAATGMGMGMGTGMGMGMAVGPGVGAGTAVGHLDQFCQSWMGAGHVPSYDVRQNPQHGLFGAVLRIPLPPPAHVPHGGPPNVKAYWVDFDHPTRAAAQEAVAVLAVRDGVVEQIRSEVPPRSRFGSLERGGAGAGWGGGGGGGFQLRPPQYPGGASVGVGASSPYLSQQSAFAAAAFAASGGGGGHKRALEAQPSPLPQKKKKQKKDAPGGGPPSVASSSGAGAGAGAGAGEGAGAGAGAGQGKKQRTSSVSALHFACRDRLGGDARWRPSYEVREEGSRFGATLTVALSTTSTDSRIVVVVPAVHSSKREAREAVARKAIEEARVLDLLPPGAEGVQAVEGTVGGASASSSSASVVVKTEVVPPPQQQREAVQPSGSGSLATLVKKPPSSPPSSVPILRGGKKSAKVRLEEYCAASSRPAPVFTRESSSSGGARVWVVIADLKFELPNPPATPGEGEEKLAGRVLRHLMSQDQGKVKVKEEP
ncbi:hypothetical protein JCM5296_007330 [Sporobolomyces johnsonii]